jgi:hypothetical protein
MTSIESKYLLIICEGPRALPSRSAARIIDACTDVSLDSSQLCRGGGGEGGRGSGVMVCGGIKEF